MDRRKRKTREAIIEACLVLVETKGFEAMTIADIAAQADINRGTFYLHFADKYVMLDELEHMLIEEVEQAVVTNVSSENIVASRYEVLLHIFTTFKEHRTVLALIFKGRGTQSFQQKLNELFERVFYEQSALLGIDIQLPVALFKIIVVAINVGIAKYWIEGNEDYSPEQLATAMLSIIVNGPVRAAGLMTEGMIDVSDWIKEVE